MSVTDIAVAIWLVGIFFWPENAGQTVGQFLRAVENARSSSPAQDQTKGDESNG